MAIKSTKTKFGSLFLGIRSLTLWQTFYSVVFLLRRLVFVVIVIFLEEIPSLAVILVLILNNAFVAYIALASPHNDQVIFYLELLNEWALQLITSHLLISWLSTSVRFDSILGWSLISFISALFALNMIFIIWQTVKSVWN